MIVTVPCSVTPGVKPILEQWICLHRRGLLSLCRSVPAHTASSLLGVLLSSHTERCIEETRIYSKFFLNPDHFLPFTEVDRYEDRVRYLMGDYKELMH